MEITKRSNKGAERQAIIDEAHLTVGYVYFELSDYKAATRHFLEVTPAFYDHPDALLAAGWAAFKDRDYRAALSALNQLVADYPDYYNLEEAYFLRGHCHLKLGYYDFAIGEYDRIFSGPGDTTETARWLNAARLGLGAQQKRMGELRTQLLLLESKLVQSIPFDADDEHSDTTLEDPQIVQKAREGLIKKILNERQEFDRVLDKITELKREVDKGKMRKKWQAYAEYGKVPALFLQGMISK